MGDIREMLALLAPGAANMDGVGSNTDLRQRLLMALARVRPAWAGDLMLARYADIQGARRTVEYALMSELASAVWPEKNPPGTLRAMVYLALSEYMTPPSCLSCTGTTQTWRMVDGAVTPVDCPACGGSGRRRFTQEELADISGLPWQTWKPRHAMLHRMLRMNERAAIATMREALADDVVEGA